MGTRVNSPIIKIGCNYHTTWQSDKSMRFVLVEVNGDKAKLKVSDRGFITSPINEFFLKQQPNMIHLHKKLKTIK